MTATPRSKANRRDEATHQPDQQYDSAYSMNTSDRHRTAAAIYARKSTEQQGVADEQRSVTRQIETARAFIVEKGWTIDDHHVFADDGFSGAEFDSRPAF